MGIKEAGGSRFGGLGGLGLEASEQPHVGKGPDLPQAQASGGRTLGVTGSRRGSGLLGMGDTGPDYTPI